ncbi:hypothetical protein C8R46DRAFT_1238483 [Mycena filopes]|nr:hypothetical protein C8R46DRAFT_1238483 [Mycena filopes]
MSTATPSSLSSGASMKPKSKLPDDEVLHRRAEAAFRYRRRNQDAINEKARLRMQKRRAALKQAPSAVQVEHQVKARQYRRKYIEYVTQQAGTTFTTDPQEEHESQQRTYGDLLSLADSFCVSVAVLSPVHPASAPQMGLSNPCFASDTNSRTPAQSTSHGTKRTQKAMPQAEVMPRSGAWWQEQHRLRRARLATEASEAQIARGNTWILPAPKHGQPSAAVAARRNGPSEADIRSAQEDAITLAKLDASNKRLKRRRGASNWIASEPPSNWLDRRGPTSSPKARLSSSPKKRHSCRDDMFLRRI